MVKISVIVATKNRYSLLNQCIGSIFTNTFRNYEIILVDQSRPAIDIDKQFPKAGERLKYVRYLKEGKSSALNYGISLAKGKILAFTDDDCVVDKNWLKNIIAAFKHHPTIWGVFGKTKPYKPEIHKHEMCPATTLNMKQQIIMKPAHHALVVGFGNNMAFRINLFQKIGLFKTWLGPGTQAMAAEDGELIVRALIAGFPLFHTHSVIVYHNKWLSGNAIKIQNNIYACGETACYGYYSLSGYDFAKTVVKNNIIESCRDFKKICGDIMKRGVIKSDEWKYSVIKFFTRLKGVFIGTFYYMKEAKFRIEDSTMSVNKF